MPDRSLFYCYGAYVTTQLSATRCRWFPDDPNTLGWDPAMQIEVDLGKNATARRTGAIATSDIDADDHAVFGGMTKIGPDFPLGETIGACWVTEAAYTRSVGRAPLSPPPDDAFAYELTQVLYWDGPLASRRFQGVHARINSAQGTVAQVTIWNPGTARAPGALPAGTWWIDLAQQHPVEVGFTDVAQPNDEGALFLDLQVVRQLGLADPKRPPITGTSTL